MHESLRKGMGVPTQRQWSIVHTLGNDSLSVAVIEKRYDRSGVFRNADIVHQEHVTRRDGPGAVQQALERCEDEVLDLIARSWSS